MRLFNEDALACVRDSAPSTWICLVSTLCEARRWRGVSVRMYKASRGQVLC